MKLIRTQQCPLSSAESPLSGREQLRADRRFQNIQEDFPQLGIFRFHGLMPHQVPYQSLGNGGVDPVHGHMISIVGGPSQGEFRQIPGAYHQASGHVGDIHEYLRPLLAWEFS